MADNVVLQPISMLRPNNQRIYAPSRLRPIKVIDYTIFLNRYADTALIILVSFCEDAISNPMPITAYGFGLDCWYIRI